MLLVLIGCKSTWVVVFALQTYWQLWKCYVGYTVMAKLSTPTVVIGKTYKYYKNVLSEDLISKYSYTGS